MDARGKLSSTDALQLVGTPQTADHRAEHSARMPPAALTARRQGQIDVTERSKEVPMALTPICRQVSAPDLRTSKRDYARCDLCLTQRTQPSPQEILPWAGGHKGPGRSPRCSKTSPMPGRPKPRGARCHWLWASFFGSFTYRRTQHRQGGHVALLALCEGDRRQGLLCSVHGGHLRDGGQCDQELTSKNERYRHDRIKAPLLRPR